MTGFVLSPRAQADIDEIWDYTVRTWDQAQAESYLRDIQGALRSLVADPSKGRACDDIRAGYKKQPVGSHVLFFRLVGDDIEVIRILHQRMDFSHHI